MPTKKVVAKKAMAKICGSCPTCGCCCSQKGEIESIVHIIFGGLVVALSFFLLQTML